MKNKLALVVAIVLGLIAVYGVHTYINSVKEKVREQDKYVLVATARDYIRANTQIKPQHLDANGKKVPDSVVTSDYVLVGDQARLIGQTINRSVERGEPLLYSYFRRPVVQLDSALGPKERALTLRVDSITGVAGNLVPGSCVDVIGTFPMAKEAAKPGGGAGAGSSNRTLLLLSNVKIIAVDSRVREDEYVAATGAQRSRNYSSITVAVTPTEANMLVFAQQFGVLTMALRQPTETAASAVPDVTEKSFDDVAKQVQKEREDRLKNQVPIESLLPASGK